MNLQPDIAVRYRNHRGETTTRRVVPEKVWFGQTEWHPEPQWLLQCWDQDKGARRDFALADCDFAGANQ